MTALVLIAASAWVAGDRALRVAAVLVLVGVMPVAFLHQTRGLETVCIPFTGLALMAGWWLSRLSWIVPWRGRAPLLFALLLILLWLQHAGRMPPEDAMLREGRTIARVWGEWRKIQPPIMAKSRVLITVDPFAPPMVWATTFIARIEHGLTFRIVRESNEPQPPRRDDFDFVLAWENGRFVALKAPSPPR